MLESAEIAAIVPVSPGLKTENGIGRIGDLLAAWCKDPDGNIIAFEERTGAG